MFTLLSLLLVTVSFAQTNQINNRPISPYALEDEVKNQVDELKSTVQGSIATALDNLGSLIDSHEEFKVNSLTEAAVSIQQGHESLNEVLTNIKDLAAAGNQNITICLIYNEPFFQRLPQDFINSLPDCVIISDREVTGIENDARYYIDTIVNEVDRFDFQITTCKGEFDCLSVLVTQIELAKIDIPQKVLVQVDNARGLLDDLKITIGECSNAKIGSYSAEGSTILADIEQCVERLPS